MYYLLCDSIVVNSIMGTLGLGAFGREDKGGRKRGEEAKRREEGRKGKEEEEGRKGGREGGVD